MGEHESAIQRPAPAIDWGGAEVRSGTLVVALSTGAAKAWRARARVLLERLRPSGAAWGEVTFDKRRIEVADVSEGSEDEVRHLLESVVLQANAEFAADGDGGGARAQPGAQDPGVERDRRMTDAFRSFADRGAAG